MENIRNRFLEAVQGEAKAMQLDRRFGEDAYVASIEMLKIALNEADSPCLGLLQYEARQRVKGESVQGQVIDGFKRVFAKLTI